MVDLGAIWKPVTGISFQLLRLSETPQDNIQFGHFPGIAEMNATSSVIARHTGDFGEYKLSLNYNIADEMIAWLKGKDCHKTFACSYKEFNPDKLLLRYYEPDLMQNEKDIRSGDFKPLNEIADILLPRQEKKPGKVLSPRYFEYPLSISRIEEKNTTNIELQKGDILYARHGAGRSYLVTEQPKKTLYAHTGTFVIRLKDQSIIPEYLLLYLQSDTGKKYAQRYAQGTVIQFLSAKVLREFPIKIPSKHVQERAKSLFETLYLTPEENLVERVNQELFATGEPEGNKIEVEFLLEQLSRAKKWKLSAVRDVIASDLKEIDVCFKAKAYKSCVILCGSVLEAVLLDWISEIERHDYISSEEGLTLFNMIKSFSDNRILGKREADLAHNIRKMRNIVHPKEMLKSSELNEKQCEALISGLRKILHKRFKILEDKS
ncbi:MAG: restriction endonuclease subunit S [Alphaproteobacteria bacterium]